MGNHRFVGDHSFTCWAFDSPSKSSQIFDNHNRHRNRLFFKEKRPNRLNTFTIKMGFYAVIDAKSSCLIYFSVQPSWIYLIPLLLFIAMKGLDLVWDKQISIFLKRLKQLENQSLISMKRFASFEVKDMTF